jgi:hypothetical protein
MYMLFVQFKNSISQFEVLDTIPNSGGVLPFAKVENILKMLSILSPNILYHRVNVWCTIVQWF